MMLNYNSSLIKRWNDLFRKIFRIPKMRHKLKNKNFTLFSNNCNGGFIYHDLGVRFNSPTINMFFYNDHFFIFLEHLEEYLSEEIRLCNHPCYTPEFDYPVCNLGGDSSSYRTAFYALFKLYGGEK